MGQEEQVVLELLTKDMLVEMLEPHKGPLLVEVVRVLLELIKEMEHTREPLLELLVVTVLLHQSQAQA
jgi:hypothetical protein